MFSCYKDEDHQPFFIIVKALEGECPEKPQGTDGPNQQYKGTMYVTVKVEMQ